MGLAGQAVYQMLRSWREGLAMFCIIVVTYVGVQIISQETTTFCYPTHAECMNDTPRIAHMIIPAEGRGYGFRCVQEVRA